MIRLPFYGRPVELELLDQFVEEKPPHHMEQTAFRVEVSLNLFIYSGELL
jgi:hypothetical protein